MNGRSGWLRKRPETFWVQVGCGLTTLAWGITILANNSPMHDMPVYDETVQHVPAWGWARMAVVIGAAQFGCALAGLRWVGAQAWPRRITGLLVMLFWQVLAVSMINSGAPTKMPVVLCGLALMNLPVVVLPIMRAR